MSGGNNDLYGVADMLAIYCPICQREVLPDNIQEVARGEHDGFIYIHDDIIHDDDDIAAIEAGIQ